MFAQRISDAMEVKTLWIFVNNELSFTIKQKNTARMVLTLLKVTTEHK